MWQSHHTHKARLALRSSQSALRPHPQLPLWSVMGLLRSASSILITGQNPLNGIWFAMKGRGTAVSHWTRLSHDSPPPRPNSPSQVEAGMLTLPCITPAIPVAWLDVCVCVCWGQRWRGRAAVPWETLFVAYRSMGASMLRGLDRLKGMEVQLAQQPRSLEENTGRRCCFELTNASGRLIFSAGAERSALWKSLMKSQLVLSHFFFA